MRVLGIDCGSEITGYAVVEQSSSASLHCVTCGAIQLAHRDPLSLRLKKVAEELSKVIEAHLPGRVAVEEVFYAANAKSALKLGHVRGVALLAAANYGLQVNEYAPLAIKSAVVGYGKAEKSQVQQMVMRLLNLPARPEPPDVADALAVAICDLHTCATLARQHASSR
jgi:crossover junction endodeoxyribonuclease RuvC